MAFTSFLNLSFDILFLKAFPDFRNLHLFLFLMLYACNKHPAHPGRQKQGEKQVFQTASEMFYGKYKKGLDKIVKKI